jgi:hypothetical protein
MGSGAAAFVMIAPMVEKNLMEKSVDSIRMG